MYLVSWEEGAEGLGGWWLEKDKSLEYEPSICSPKEVLRAMKICS
jgi:hypothetical protein